MLTLITVLLFLKNKNKITKKLQTVNLPALLLAPVDEDIWRSFRVVLCCPPPEELVVLFWDRLEVSPDLPPVERPPPDSRSEDLSCVCCWLWPDLWFELFWELELVCSVTVLCWTFCFNLLEFMFRLWVRL